MDWANATAGDIFLSILQVVSDAVTQLVSLLPNPDPFPEIINSIDFDAAGSGLMAIWWADQFIDMEFITQLTLSWLFMFPIAWVIMMIWKWLRAR